MAKFNANLLDDNCLYVFYSKRHDAFIDLDGFSGKASYCSFHDDMTVTTSDPDRVERLWKNIFDSIEDDNKKTSRSLLYIDSVDLVPIIDGLPDFRDAVDLHTLLGEGSK